MHITPADTYFDEVLNKSCDGVCFEKNHECICWYEEHVRFQSWIVLDLRIEENLTHYTLQLKRVSVPHN